jgi:hypothetical protein
VKQLIAGVKYTSQYLQTNASTGMCPNTWTTTVPPECCVKDDTSDCYGEYIPVDTTPYDFHTDCIGKNTCSGRAAPFMDSIYLNCNQSIYPAQTTYFYNEFYCINGKKYSKQVFSCKDIFNAMQGNMNYESQETNK